jgi:hypothetical protein
VDFFDECGHRLALIRSKGGDIHEPCNLVIVSSFGDHRSSIGVAYENCRPVLGCKNALGNRHVVLERYCGILDDADIVAVLLQRVVDAFPSRAVHKPPWTSTMLFAVFIAPYLLKAE